MNKTIFAIFVTITIVNAGRIDSLHTLWSTWKIQHNKFYRETEELVRFGIFVENVEKVARMNAESTTAQFGLNKFADLTSTEFSFHYASSSFYEYEVEITEVQANSNLPDEVDWRQKGAVTPVKDQGECGSSWAFSATGVIEGTYFIKQGKLLSFSEQQIVDCAHNAGYGCLGGWPYLTIQYSAQNGLETESDYPYNAKEGNCKFDSSKALPVTSGYKFITSKSTDLLKTALIDSPVSVLVQADEDNFRFYKSGVLTVGCGATLNHAALVVGYKKMGILEAFIVKNSWGTNWGADGYIYISTIQQLNNGQGACGILAQPVVSN